MGALSWYTCSSPWHHDVPPWDLLDPSRAQAIEQSLPPRERGAGGLGPTPEPEATSCGQFPSNPPAVYGQNCSAAFEILFAP